MFSFRSLILREMREDEGIEEELSDGAVIVFALPQMRNFYELYLIANPGTSMEV